MRRWPEAMSLRVFERPPLTGGMAPQFIAEIFLGVPGSGKDATPVRERGASHRT